ARPPAPGLPRDPRLHPPGARAAVRAGRPDAARRVPGASDGGQVARDDLHQGEHPHAGLVRGGRVAARGARALPLAARRAARPRRAHRRHRARAVALRGRDHDPHLRALGRRGARALRGRARDQRAHRPAPPVPDPRRPAHRAPAPRWLRGEAHRVGGGRQQHGQLLAQRRLPARLRAHAGLSGGVRPRSGDPGPGAARRARHPRARPARGGGGGARREHRRVGLDGAGGGAARARARVRWLHRRRCADGARHPRRDLPALPPRAPRGGGERGRARGAAEPRVGRGREPPPHPEGDHGRPAGRRRRGL
ncbi:MAG: Ornithine carbamoyltransferase, partial [uncultured Gemmatimonadaceae bacterium]